MSNPYENMTDADFDRILLELMEEDGMESVLQIPGVYSDVMEHYNNDVLSRWEEENPEEDEEDEDE